MDEQTARAIASGVGDPMLSLASWAAKQGMKSTSREETEIWVMVCTRINTMTTEIAQNLKKIKDDEQS